MAAEYSSNMLQTIPVNGSVIFTESPVPCSRGLIFHREESGAFRLASPSAMSNGCFYCCRCGMPEADYEVSFHANIQIPAGGTVEPISLALAIDGEVDPSSEMIFTPAAAQEFGNVGADIIVSVPWICRCTSVSVKNTSTQPIEVQNANIVFDFNGIRR